MVAVTRGRSNPVNLRFRVGSGFHVNSNHPKSEFLIPTALKLSAPTDIVIGRVSYPAGAEMSFAFAPDDKLSVYTGEFPVVVEVRPLAEVVPAKYMIRGELKYQACDNAACYPPKKLPVQFEIQVVKAPPPHRKNPGQSPHISPVAAHDLYGWKAMGKRSEMLKMVTLPYNGAWNGEMPE